MVAHSPSLHSLLLNAAVSTSGALTPPMCCGSGRGFFIDVPRAEATFEWRCFVGGTTTIGTSLCRFKLFFPTFAGIGQSVNFAATSSRSITSPSDTLENLMEIWNNDVCGITSFIGLPFEIRSGAHMIASSSLKHNSALTHGPRHILAVTFTESVEHRAGHVSNCNTPCPPFATPTR